MAATVYLAEGVPAGYPTAPTGLSPAAAALDPDFIWQRIEAYVSVRWSIRDVSYVVEGCGEWKPDLTPTTITSTEKWVDGAWTPVTLPAEPLGGYELADDGPYRFVGTVGEGVAFLAALSIATMGFINTTGGGAAPAAANEAFRRLAEFMADSTAGPAGATSSSHDLGPVSVSHVRSASWLAKAIQSSGAADLLRQYRKV